MHPFDYVLLGLFFALLLWVLWILFDSTDTGNKQRHEELMAQLKGIVMTQAELAAELRGLKALVQKIGTETSATLQKVLDLEAVIASGSPVSEEVLTALAELKTQAVATDDLVPDAAPPTT